MGRARLLCTWQRLDKFKLITHVLKSSWWQNSVNLFVLTAVLCGSVHCFRVQLILRHQGSDIIILMMEVELVSEMVYLNHLTWLSAWEDLSLYTYEEYAFFPLLGIVDLKFIPHNWNWTSIYSEIFCAICLKMHHKECPEKYGRDMCLCWDSAPSYSLQEFLVTGFMTCPTPSILPTSPPSASFSEIQFITELEEV